MTKDDIFYQILKRLEPYFNKANLYFGIIFIIMGLLQLLRENFLIFTFYDILFGIVCLLLYANRSKIRLKIKMMIVSCFLLFFSILSLNVSGFQGNGIIALAMLIVYAMAFLPKFPAILLSSLSVLTVLSYGIAAYFGYFDLSRLDVKRLISPLDWMYQAVGLFVFAMLCYLSIFSIKRMLVDSINDKASANANLRVIAYTDTLTGLPNRVSLFETYQHRKPDMNQTTRMVVIIDVINFKLINVQHGFTVAEAYLKAIAIEGMDFLKRHNSNFTYSRIGDDEFAIVSEHLTLQNLESFIEVLSETIRRNHPLVSELPQQDFIAAYTLWHPDKETFEQAFKQCVLTVKHAKVNRKLGIIPYHHDIYQKIEDDSQLLSEVKKAIETDAFKVVFQGKWSHRKQRFIGYEALSRWTPPGSKPIPPNEFIPLINQSVHFTQFNRYITEKAISIFEQIQAQSENPLKLSINISPLFFLSDNFVSFMYEVISKSQLSTDQVILEITEDVFINDYMEIETRIKNLQDLGFIISLDDFGSGYSSLSHLNSLNVQEIKIDKTITQNVLSHQKSRILVEMISSMASRMKYDLVAEGVETEEQCTLLTSLGIDILQGYYFSKPTAIEDILSK